VGFRFCEKERASTTFHPATNVREKVGEIISD